MENQVEKTIKHERDYRVSWFWISCIIMVLRTSNSNMMLVIIQAGRILSICCGLYGC